MQQDLLAEALLTFAELLDQARATADPEPTAMTVASIDDDGRIAARTVLLKSFDERGFVFYTNHHSRKGQELLAHPQTALLFHWKTLRHGVQVRIEGHAEVVDAAEADRYFASRPRGSQIGAWASFQTETLPDRETFEQRVDEYERHFAGIPVARPPHWSGFRVVPDRFEFWYGAEFRLHERWFYERDAAGEWSKRMLYP